MSSGSTEYYNSIRTEPYLESVPETASVILRTSLERGELLYKIEKPIYPKKNPLKKSS
jgi:hypothetical protein